MYLHTLRPAFLSVVFCRMAVSSQSKAKSLLLCRLFFPLMFQWSFLSLVMRGFCLPLLSSLNLQAVYSCMFLFLHSKEISGTEIGRN